MRRYYSLIAVFVITIYGFNSQATAQNVDIDKCIEKNRKGTLVINAEPGVSVTIEQLQHEFWFGCAIPNSLFDGSMSPENSEMFKKMFLENFNAAVTENAVKWGSMERKKGEVDYRIIDAMLEWTDKNNLPLRGHNIFWGIEQFVQPWVKELDNNELEITLKNRAESLTLRYKGRFAEYDLNNEMVHGNYYAERLGADITKKMAEWCKKGDPDILLYLNDYDILTGKKLPEYLAQIRLFIKQGVPIAGIGVQGHLHAELFDREELKRALDTLAQFNLPIRVTEFNIPGQNSKYYNNRNMKMTDEEEEQNAQELVDYYRICFAHPAVEGILMWGFWEGANWIPQSSLYKRDWTPTPAAKAYHELIYNEWQTNVKGKINANGTFSTPAFYGKYKVTVDGKSQTIELKKTEGKVVAEF